VVLQRYAAKVSGSKFMLTKGNSKMVAILNEKSIRYPILVAPAIMCLVALLELPYGYGLSQHLAVSDAA